jgi:hypothetical protein
LTTQPCILAATPDITAAKADGQAALAAQEPVFQTSVSPQLDEDLTAPCRYEITLRSAHQM